MSLLPSEPDTAAVDSDAEPRVIGVDSDDADDVISALSSETARKLLAELHEEPAPPSKLADRVDTSLQNAQYHLEKLQAAGAVSVVDTAYSAKGREMDVYAPADEPLVIFAGDEEKSSGLKAALSRFLGGLGILGLSSLAVQHFYGDAGEQSGGFEPTGGDSADSADGAAPPPETATPDSEPEMTVAPADKATPDPTSGNTELADTVVTFDAQNETVYLTDVNGTKLQTIENVTSVTYPNGTELQSGEGVTAITDSVVIETARATPEATDAAASTAGIDPALAFFAGGLVILTLWLSVWYVKNR